MATPPNMTPLPYIHEAMPTSSTATHTLLSLPTEILLHLLTYLPIPDLLAISRTCHTLRTLSLDPLLHRHRLTLASHAISIYLPYRPSLSSLRPPTRNIYLTRALFQARQVSQRLAGIRLNKRLHLRPSVGELVDRGVLPIDCFVLVPGRRSCEDAAGSHAETPKGGDGEFAKGEGMKKDEWVRTTISPQVMVARQSLERERVKDRLRSFLSGRGKEEIERRRAREEKAKEREGVRVLVKRYARREKDEGDAPKWGTGARKGGNRPARANVLGLRRYWEGASV